MSKKLNLAMQQRLSRRKFLQGSAATVGGLALGAQSLQFSHAQAASIDFWSQPYGDAIEWKRLLDGLSADFANESGTEALVEIINWGNAGKTWLLVDQGGAHPDVGDMFWLHSHAGIGAGQHGPMPITEYKDMWPDLEDRFFAGALNDVFWQDEFYGIPWRGDIRPQLVRTDALSEAGFDRAPDNWDEITEYAKALTVRDGSGNVTRWGFAFGTALPIQQFFPYYWQAGGEFMSEDGKTATVDNDAMRETLTWLRDMVWKHEVVSPDLMESSYSPLDDLVSGTLAMAGSVPDNGIKNLEIDFPELDGMWQAEIPFEGSARRVGYSGAGYWGLLRGTEKVEESVKWLEFLSRDVNMQKITEFTSGVSPNKNVMASDFWSDRPWKIKIAESLEFGHTSQHPSPAWSTISANDPGGVLYDMFFSAVVLQEDLNETITTAQTRMQAELDKV